LYAGWDGGGLIRFFILRTAIDFAWHPVETCEGGKLQCTSFRRGLRFGVGVNQIV
jgi:hypothetical protein